MSDADRSFPIFERATQLMRAHSLSASPASYELWFTFVAGLSIPLNREIQDLIDSGRQLTETDAHDLKARHLLDIKALAKVDITGAQMAAEIEEVMNFIDTALGSTAKYDASLTAIKAGLDNRLGSESLREILETLVVATQEVASTNRSLESRLRDSRGEIESLRETLEVVKREGLTDPLTGIANRKSFEEVLARETEAADKTGGSLALVVIDIDRFKRFNDLYGHLTGDQVLRLVGVAMRETVDPAATLARFGGEEFAMILPGFDPDRAFACAESVRKSVEGRDLLRKSTGESLGRVTISLGVAFLQPEETATSLLERADRCMYEAKRSGRNRTIADYTLGPAAIPDAA